MNKRIFLMYIETHRNPTGTVKDHNLKWPWITDVSSLWFSSMASDWLAALLPASQKPGLKT